MKKVFILLGVVIMLLYIMPTVNSIVSSCANNSCILVGANEILADLSLRDISKPTTKWDEGVLQKWNMTLVCDMTDFEAITMAYLELYVDALRNNGGGLDDDVNISYVQNQSVTEDSTAAGINLMPISNITLNTTAWENSESDRYHNITVTKFAQVACNMSENMTIILEDPDVTTRPFLNTVDLAHSYIGLWDDNIMTPGHEHYEIDTREASYPAFLWIEYVLTQKVPTHDTPVITPNVIDASYNFTCIPQNIVDQNADNYSVVFNWILDDQPIAVVNYAFDNNLSSISSEVIKDYSGTGRNGSCSGSVCPVTVSSGKVFGGMQFNGQNSANNWINVSDSNGLSLTDGLTLEAWINMSSAKGDTAIIAKWPGSSGYMLYIDSSEQPKFYISGTSVTGDTVLGTNEWYHLVGTWNGSDMVLYVNGKQNNTGSDSTIGTNTIPVTIGTYNDRSQSVFNGTMDNLRIYNRSLTRDQVYQLYLDGYYSYHNSTIVSNETSASDNWSCQVTPTDGYGDGITKDNSTTIDDCIFIQDGLNLKDDSYDCFRFNVGDAALDCGNKYIYGQTRTTPSIKAVDVDNIHIRRCYIQNASTAINFTRANSSSIVDTTIFNTTDWTSGDTTTHAIYMSESEGNTINVNITVVNSTSTSTSDCFISKSYGMHIIDSFNISIVNSSIYDVRGQQQGVDLEGCNPSTRPEIGQGIYMDDSNNVSILNTTVNLTEQGNIYVLSSSKYLNVSKCVIQSSNDEGIYAYGVEHVDITDNLFMYNVVGIEVSSSSNYPDIKRNEIRYGEIGIELSGIGGILEDNVIMHTQSDSSGIGAILTNSINFESWRNNTIHNTTYTNPTSTAIHPARDRIMIGDNITNYTTAYYFGSLSDNTIIYNATIDGGENTTILEGATNVTFFNCTFNKSSNIFESGSNSIHVYYPLRINVTNSSDVPIEGANVNITNQSSSANDDWFIQTTTDSDGLTGWFWVEEYNQTADAEYVSGCTGSDAGITCLAPQNITTSIITYSDNSTEVTIDESMMYRVNMGDQQCSIAIGLSGNLSNGVNWTIASLPADNAAANGNNGSGVTQYNVSVIVSGPCGADVYIKADGDLTGTSEVIGIGNETYCNSTSDSLVPGTACHILDTTYASDGIGSSLDVGTNTIHLKFYLDVPTAQPADSYTNTLSIGGWENTSSPGDEVCGDANAEGAEICDSDLTLECSGPGSEDHYKGSYVYAVDECDTPLHSACKDTCDSCVTGIQCDP